MSQSLTIARALRSAKKLAGVIAERQSRLKAAASWREGQPTAFNFADTLAEHDAAVDELVCLRSRMALANASTTLEHHGRELTLAEAIRRTEELKGRAALFAALTLTAGERREVVEYDERGRPVYETVRQVAVWTEAERAARVEAIRAELEELVDAIEEANHRTRLS